MTIQNKNTGATHEVTAAQYAAICARGEAWKNLYLVISAPEPDVPKEIKKTVRAKQTPEFDTNGIEATDGGFSEQDAGEIQ